jgi:hypothetical protein
MADSQLEEIAHAFILNKNVGGSVVTNNHQWFTWFRWFHRASNQTADLELRYDTIRAYFRREIDFSWIRTHSGADGLE